MKISSEFLEQLCTICVETGNYIKEESKKFSLESVEEKARFSDLVSYVDKTSEKMLVDRLTKLLPDSGIMAEEGTARSGTYTWIIDPLDGTTNFIHGLPVYCVSVALAKGEELIAGVVYEIVRDECFYAAKDQGAYLNGKPISVSRVKSLNGSLLATGFPYYEFENLPNYLNILKEFMQCTQGLRRVGSAAADLAYTACGRFEGFFEYNLKPWDLAAGALLVKEAGGIVTDFEGGNTFLTGKQIIAAGPLHEDIKSVINRYWK